MGLIGKIKNKIKDIYSSDDISEKEYEILSKMVAKEIGMELFDKSTYEASRLMYWPSTSLDGEFVYKKIDGKLLDANYYLSKYDATK